jgi:hypothetical protein
MTVFEALPKIWPFDVGINLLFHFVRGALCPIMDAEQ